MKEVSNGFLSKLFSAEMAFAFISLVFAVGFTWASLNSEVRAINQQVDSQAQKQEKLAVAVNSIQTDIQVIKVDQHHTKESVQELKRDLRAIRNLLEQRGSTR